MDSFPFLGVYISGVVYISWSGRPEGVQFGGRFVHPVDKKVETVGYKTYPNLVKYNRPKRDPRCIEIGSKVKVTVNAK